MIRALWNWHEQPGLVAFAQGRIGRLLLWLAAMLLLYRHDSPWVAMGAASVAMVAPAYRRSLLAIASLGVIVHGLYPDGEPAWLALTGKAAVVLLALYIAYLLLRELPRWPAFARRRPLLVLHAGLWIAIALSQLAPLAVLGQVSFLAWRLGYTVKDASRGLLSSSRFRDHLMYLMPSWGGYATPIGKGLDYLSRHEAHTPEAIARSQLAGIKLMLLGLAWALLHGWLTDNVIDVAGGIPSLTTTLESDNMPPWYLGWAIIYVELVRKVLQVCIHGHLFVGALRFFGFNVYRNTYKPLLAESVVDFWGRFYFYFKEVLVDFFFYPVYLRLRRLQPQIRLGLAVFAAAFVGNMYYHLLFYEPLDVVQGNWEMVWSRWGTRLVYCFLLALGIWISMIRQQKRRLKETSPPGWPIRLRRIAIVLTFYAIIRIWNDRSLDSDTVDAFQFFVSLFGF